MQRTSLLAGVVNEAGMMLSPQAGLRRLLVVVLLNISIKTSPFGLTGYYDKGIVMQLLAFNKQNTTIKIYISEDGQDFIFIGLDSLPKYLSFYLHSNLTRTQQLEDRIEQAGFNTSDFIYTA